MNPLSKLEIYGIGLLVVILAAAAFGFYEHHQGYLAGKKEVQVEFDAFKNDVKEIGLKAEAEKQRKEQENAKRLADANAVGAAALARLRDEQARPRGGFVPNGSGAAGGSKICFDRSTLDAALRKLDQGVSGLFFESDGTLINAQTVVKGWPK